MCCEDVVEVARAVGDVHGRLTGESLRIDVDVEAPGSTRCRLGACPEPQRGRPAGPTGVLLRLRPGLQVVTSWLAVSRPVGDSPSPG